MRLFLGSFATVEFYDEIQRDMAPYFDAKWVAPKNLHLTWFFLGETPDAAPVIDRLRPLRSIPRQPLSIQGIGTFGQPHPKVFYLKTASIVAMSLHEKIAEWLGQEPDLPFRPHITLARIKHYRSNRWRHLERPWMSEPLGFVEPEIYLIESRLTAAGPVYLPIEVF